MRTPQTDPTLLQDAPTPFFHFVRSTKPNPWISGVVDLPWEHDLQRMLREAEDKNATLTTANTWPRRWTRSYYKVRNGKAIRIGERPYWESVAGEFKQSETFEELEITLQAISGRSAKVPHIGGLPIEHLR